MINIAYALWGVGGLDSNRQKKPLQISAYESSYLMGIMTGSGS